MSHPANASCTEPAGANSFFYYITRLDSEKPDHPVMARRGKKEKKGIFSLCVTKEKAAEGSDRVCCFRISGWMDG